MTYATELPEVQKSLGIEINSNVSEAPYAKAQREAIEAGRLEIKEKAHPVSGAQMWGAFVDGVLVAFRVNGNPVKLDDEKRSKFSSAF